MPVRTAAATLLASRSEPASTGAAGCIDVGRCRNTDLGTARP